MESLPVDSENPSHKFSDLLLGFVFNATHVFLILVIIVGWAILPKKLIWPLLGVMVAVPTLWAAMDGECVLTRWTNQLDTPDYMRIQNENGFIADTIESLGIEMKKSQNRGMIFIILGTLLTLTAMRLCKN